MATKTIHIDDLTGEENDLVKSRKLSLDGKSGNVDLGDAAYNALEAFILKADPTLLRELLAPPPAVRVRRSREDSAEIRAWARANGHEVSDNGRIPGPVTEAYDKAHATPAESAEK